MRGDWSTQRSSDFPSHTAGERQSQQHKTITKERERHEVQHKGVPFAEGEFINQKTVLEGRADLPCVPPTEESSPTLSGARNLFVWIGVKGSFLKISFRVSLPPLPTNQLPAFFLKSSTSEKRTDRHSRWEAMWVHDDVRTDARITKWHVFLRDNQATNTWGKEDFMHVRANGQKGRIQHLTGICPLLYFHCSQTFPVVSIESNKSNFQQSCWTNSFKRLSSQEDAAACGLACWPDDDGAVRLPAQPPTPLRWKSSDCTGSWPAHVPETSSQHQSHCRLVRSATHCTRITGIQVLWPLNTELIEWGVCFTCGFKSLWQVLVCGWCANGSTYWREALADFCQGSTGWA